MDEYASVAQACFRFHHGDPRAQILNIGARSGLRQKHRIGPRSDDCCEIVIGQTGVQCVDPDDESRSRKRSLSACDKFGHVFPGLGLA